MVSGNENTPKLHRRRRFGRGRFLRRLGASLSHGQRRQTPNQRHEQREMDAKKHGSPRRLKKEIETNRAGDNQNLKQIQKNEELQSSQPFPPTYMVRRRLIRAANIHARAHLRPRRSTAIGKTRASFDLAPRAGERFGPLGFLHLHLFRTWNLNCDRFARLSRCQERESGTGVAIGAVKVDDPPPRGSWPAGDCRWAAGSVESRSKT